MKRKKLLVLVDWFWPGYKAGGPIKSCVNLCAALNKEFDIYVLTTDTDHGEVQPYQGITPNHWVYNSELNVHVYYAKKNGLSTKQLGEQIKLANADVIYLNHLFSPRFVVYPLWLAFIKAVNTKIVVCPRGALYDSALSVKRYKKTPLLFVYKWLAIHKRITFHATNKREESAIQKYFPGSRVLVADNLPSFIQHPFFSVEKKEGELKCIFIARIVAIKNLSFLLEALTGVKQQVMLTIAGPVEDEMYWQGCKEQINNLPSNIKVKYMGPMAATELNTLIKEHHLFILPTKGENFGHSIFEAFQAGRPVLISNQTPWLGLADKKVGWDLPLQERAFTEIIETVAGFNQNDFDTAANNAWEYAASFIANSVEKAKYISLFS